MRKEKEFTISYTYNGRKITRDEAIEIIKEQRKEKIVNE